MEYQQAEAQRPRTTGRTPTTQERHATSRQRTLQLSLARAEADLRVATAPAHRRMLEQALMALREQLDRDFPDNAS